MGKLSEKLGYPHEQSFSYYDKAITLNPSAVDPFYRMHASRLKLLYTSGKQNLEVLKVCCFLSPIFFLVHYQMLVIVVFFPFEFYYTVIFSFSFITLFSAY